MTIERKINKIDASNKPLGRLASEVALILRGKNKADFERHIDAGDFVEVFNFNSIKITGDKKEKKMYYNHSGYPGGIKEINLKDLWTKNPQEILKKAVYGMLPKNKLRPKMFKRLIIKMGQDK